jgi:hypothetical protein
MEFLRLRLRMTAIELFAVRVEEFVEEVAYGVGEVVGSGWGGWWSRGG